MHTHTWTQLLGHGSWGAQLAFEQLYLGGCALGTLVCLARLLQLALVPRGPRRWEAIGWLALANLAGLGAMAAVWLDQHLCAAFAEHYNTIGMLVPYFAMYVLAFGALLKHREALHKSAPPAPLTLAATPSEPETAETTETKKSQ